MVHRRSVQPEQRARPIHRPPSLLGKCKVPPKYRLGSQQVEVGLDVGDGDGFDGAHGVEAGVDVDFEDDTAVAGNEVD